MWLSIFFCSTAGVCLVCARVCDISMCAFGYRPGFCEFQMPKDANVWKQPQRREKKNINQMFLQTPMRGRRL